tara:strand:+ start:237 stop:389 length:153 start_codon:yes stop_codon:yes gene_type:complete
MGCEQPGRCDNPMISEYTNIIVEMLCLSEYRRKTALQPFRKQNDKPHLDH